MKQNKTGRLGLMSVVLAITLLSSSWAAEMTKYHRKDGTQIVGRKLAEGGGRITVKRRDGKTVFITAADVVKTEGTESPTASRSTADEMMASDRSTHSAVPSNLRKSSHRDYLEKRLEHIRQESGIPALAAAIVIDARVAVACAVGHRKHGSAERVKVTDAFQIGSITKPMTATLIGVLIQKGLLRWDTTMVEAFPELRQVMKPAYRKVTVSQLLAHLGGFPYKPRTEGPDEFASKATGLMPRRYEYVKAAVIDEPEAPPGTKNIYSGGAIIAAAMAERITRRPWEQLVRKYVFGPLGMRSAGFGAMSSARVVSGPWEHLIRDGKIVPVRPDPEYAKRVHAPAGTNVHCSVIDLGKFLAAHLPHATERLPLLDPETLKVLHTPVAPGNCCPGWKASDTDWGGGRTLHHGGSNMKNMAQCYVAPRRNFAICVMTNVAGDGARQACGEAIGELIQMHRHWDLLPEVGRSLSAGGRAASSSVFRRMTKYGVDKAFDGVAAQHMLALVEDSIKYMNTLATAFDESSRKRMVKLFKEAQQELKGRLVVESAHTHHNGRGQYHTHGHGQPADHKH